MQFPSSLLEQFYAELFLIRKVEEEIVRLYPSDKIKSPVHLSIGQEPVSVGVCQALSPQDAVFGTYRNHALYLAKGGDLRKMMAELFGKDSGCTRGKGGSMHLVYPEAGFMASSAVVATTIPIAVGYAFSLKFQKEKRIAAVFFGDGAVDEGAFHEAINFAALKKLPILFVCENNFYAIHSHHLSRHVSDNICERAESYGVPAKRIEDNDVIKIFEASQAAIETVRSGNGPFFLECMTYRWKEHVGPADDFAAGYRSEEEAALWKAKDSLATIGQKLDPAHRDKIEKAAWAKIKDAIDFAERSPFPKESEVFTDVYK